MLRASKDDASNHFSWHPAQETDGLANTVTIPDTNLLFLGELTRSGPDLILSNETQKFIVHDYFRLDNSHPILLSPDGATLAPDVVLALTGSLAPGQYAQATTPQATAQSIGRVATAHGGATAVRNGVAIALNAGDAVLKGDLLQTSSDGTLGVTFNDGTAFSLTPNARLVVSEYVYSDGGSNNQALFNIVRGTMSFVASQVAKTGDMKIATPTATMGIRGTTGVIEAALDINNAVHLTIKLYPDPDGHVGRIEVFAPNGSLIGTLTQNSQDGVGLSVTPAGPLDAVAQVTNLTAANIVNDLAAVQQVFTNKTIGDQIIQQHQQQGQQQNQDQPNTANETKGTQIAITATTDTNNSVTDVKIQSTTTATDTHNNTTTTTVTTTEITTPTNPDTNLPPPPQPPPPPSDVLTATSQTAGATDHGQPATVSLLSGVSSNLSNAFSVVNFVGSALLFDASHPNGTHHDPEQYIDAGGIIFMDSTTGDAFLQRPGDTYVQITLGPDHSYTLTNHVFSRVYFDTLIIDPIKFNFLADGEALKLIASYSVSDGTATVQDSAIFTITGLNDAAVLSSATVDLNETNAPLTTYGRLSISDVDSQAVFVTESNVAGSYGHFSIDTAGGWSYVANSAFNSLNIGDILSDTFAVVSADGTTTSVAVNIHGTNDAAVISGDTSGTVTEAGISNGGGSPTATGDLSANDIDNPDNSFLVSSGTSAYGTYSLTADGVWTYTLDNNNSVVNALYEGDTLSDSFSVQSIDGTSQQISIVIKGADDSDPNDFDSSANGAHITTSGSNIFGTAGADSITGGNSGQSIYGGVGNDTIIAGNGNDAVYGGSGNDTIVGSNGNDIIYGGSGNDTIDGGKGNDIIVGGLGNDNLTGGAGADTFVFDAHFGKDVIADFKPGADVIQIDHSSFANVDALLAACHSDGNGNVVITADANDTITLQNVNIAQLVANQDSLHIV